MRTFPLLAAAFLLLFLTGCPGDTPPAATGGAKPPAASGPIPNVVWLESFDSAQAAAAKDHKLILADFTGSDWCPWCIKLREEVFNTPEFKTWAAANAILLEVDFPQDKEQSKQLKDQNKALGEKYDISGYPTILFLTAKGDKVGELGYLQGGPGVWLQRAQEIVDKNK